MTDISNQISSLSPAKRKLLDRLASSQSVAAAPIAVVGMSCRFPGANSLDEYWDLISSGRNQTREVPPERWDTKAIYDPSPETVGKSATKWACIVDGVDQFDPGFFGIAPREASRMDPQQRMLLQGCWEALEHARIDPHALTKSPTGVFVGVGQMDYSRVMAEYDNASFHLDAHCGTGQALSICANRLSYAFNWTGPSMAIDTACSSALVAVHGAMNSLRRGECDAAIAGGVNVCLTPEIFVLLSKARMLSPTGACRPFDSLANGYVRGEGCGVVVLKRLSDAIDADDNVLAVIRGSAVNHCGRTSGITAPSGVAQQQVIRSALKDAGVRPDQIEYVEAHGTGTPLGDPIEIEALSDVFASKSRRKSASPNGDGTDNSSEEKPVYLTSVKANIGHTEIAAGIAGLIKAVLIMQHGKIPAQAQLDQLNPYLQFNDSRIKIPRDDVKWESDSPRYAGVSSFGFGGTNSHVILQSVVPSKASTKDLTVDREDSLQEVAPVLMPVSARSQASLATLSKRYQEHASNQSVAASGEDDWVDMSYTAAVGRTHFDRRAVIVAADREEWLDGLQSLSEEKRSANIRLGKRQSSGSLTVAAMFTGQGSQYVGMGRGLYQTQPVYRRTMDQCDQIIRDIRGVSVVDVIEGKAPNNSLSDTAWTQPALFALEYSLARLWQSWGLEPNYLIGHSVGEYVAATVADVFDLESGLKMICRRGELMQSLPGGGSMAVVFAPGEDVEEWIAPYSSKIAVAAFNGPANTTISGTSKAVARIVKELEKHGVATQPLEVSHAFHSPLMDPILDKFAEFASQFESRAPKIPIVSNLTGKVETKAIFTPEYWRDHIRSAVRFAQGVACLKKEKTQALIEMGPSAALLGMARRCEPKLGVVAAASLKKDTDDRRFVLQSLADLYGAGFEPNWKQVFSGRNVRRVDLPGYPMDKSSFWFKPDNATRRSHNSNATSSHVTPMLGTRMISPTALVYDNYIASYVPKCLGDHVVLNDVVVPGAAYIETALSAARHVFGKSNIAVENIAFAKAMFLSESPRTFQTHVIGQSEIRRQVKIYSRASDTTDDAPWDLNASCFIVAECKVDESAPIRNRVDADEVKSRHGVMLDKKEFYEVVAARGLDYGPAFRIIEGMWRCDADVYCEASPDKSVIDDQQHYSLHPAIGDGCMQAMVGAVALEDDGSFCPDLYLPISVGKIVSLKPIDGEFGYYVRRTSEDTGPSPETVTADVSIIDRDGNPFMTLQDVCIRRVSDHSKDADNDPMDWVYEIDWKTSDPASETEPASETLTNNATETPAEADLSLGSCLIVGDGDGLAAQLTQKLESLETSAGADVRQLSNDLADNSIEPFIAELKDWSSGLDEQSTAHIILCSGLDTPDSNDTVGVQRAEQMATEMFQRLAEIQSTEFPGGVAVWLLTQGARAVTSDEILQPNQAPIIGLGQVASQELRGCNVRLVDLDPAADLTVNADALIEELQLQDAEPAIAIRSSKRYLPRLVTATSRLAEEQFSPTVPTDAAYRLRLGGEDTIDSLKFEKIRRVAPGEGQVEVQVHTAGLNFSDVLKSIGLYPGITDDVVPLGLECSGIVTAVGPGSNRFEVGDEVLGIVPYGFASHCLTSDLALVKKPKTISHEEAAIIPIAYLTAHYCLHTVARLQPGERVLIHAGAGGVGLAAIQIAKDIGAEIFATAGSDEKREFLQSLGVAHVMSSRTLEFADQISEITNGDGVDVVLNSLPGEAIDKSIESLSAYGRFVEIGKTDIYSGKPLNLTPFQDNLSYSAVDLDRLFRQRPKVASDLMTEVINRFEDGTYQPVGSTSFSISDIVGAFRFMSQRKNIGKIAVTIAQPELSGDDAEWVSADGAQSKPSIIRGDGSYLISGGLGALGVATAKWLAESGAGGVILMSRRSPDDATQAKLDEISASGTPVVAVAGDVGDADSLRAALASIPSELPPVRGVMHAAGVLRDKLFNQMSVDDFAFPLAPKMTGTINLDQATKDLDLDFFVLFSSVSSVLGTGGQSNYGAANSFLDTYAEYRRRQGCPMVAINWGAFAGSGMAADLADMMRSQGVEMLPVEESLRLIEPIVQSGQSRIAVFRADWNRFGGLLRSMMSGQLKFKLLETLAGDAIEGLVGDSSSSGDSIRDELTDLTNPQRKERLQQFFAEKLSEIMGIDPDDIDPETTLTSLGMDSLMAIELGNKMQTSLQMELPMSVYLEGPTVEKLAVYVVGVLDKESPQAESDETESTPERETVEIA